MKPNILSFATLCAATIAGCGNAIAQCSYISANRITFEADHCDYRTITAIAGEPLTVDLNGNGWLQSAGVPEGTVQPGDTVSIAVAPDGPYTCNRSAGITFTGINSGKQSTVTIDHKALKSEGATPARWFYTDELSKNGGWLTTGVAPSNQPDTPARSYVTTVGVNNRRITHSTNKRSIAAYGMYTGDYLLFSVPSLNLEAGTDIDFMLTIAASLNTAPKYWICEIEDGGEWRAPDDKDLKLTPDYEKYSFYTKFFKPYQHALFAQSFTLNHPVTNGMIRVRCRVVGDRNGLDEVLAPDNEGKIFLPSSEYHFGMIIPYSDVELRDVTKLAVLGNSFTHYFASPYMLKELARSQGHRLDVRFNAKGAQHFSNHAILERSRDVYYQPDFDYVLLQEQSIQYSNYADNPEQWLVDNCRRLTGKFRERSPKATIIVENTWAFPQKNWSGYGSMDRFQSKLLEGTMAVAGADDNVNMVSPIGVAFQKAYNSGFTDLYDTDSKHPNRNGSYLKSCVNYLMIFGEPFDDKASACGCDPGVAARLRAIAEETVLGHQSRYTFDR